MFDAVLVPMLSVIESNAIQLNKKGALQNGMSLFQDLKLKRRKVDSRCSSDGESIGTSESTASLSPEALSQSEGSPKNEKERCITPEEFAPPLSKGGGAGFAPQLFFMVKENVRSKLPYENFLVNSNGTGLNGDCHGNNNNNNNNSKGPHGVVSGVIKLSSVNEESASVKSEPGDEDSPEDNVSDSVEDNNGATPKRSNNEDAKENDQSINNGNNGDLSDDEEDERRSPRSGSTNNNVGGAIKRERDEADHQGAESIHHHQHHHHHHHQTALNGGGGSRGGSPQQRPQSRASSCSPPSGLSESSPSTLIITKQHQREMGLMNGMRDEGGMGLPPAQRIHHSMIPTQNHLHARLTGGGGGGSGGGEISCRPLTTLPGLIQVDARNMAAAEKPGGGGGGGVVAGDPISVVTSTSLSFQPHSMYRINGVRPEVISGGAVTPTTTAGTNNNNSSNNGRSMNGGSNSNSPGSVQSRKSPTLISRSPNSSPANSTSSGSIVSGGSLHSPGAPNTIVAGGALGLVNSSIGSSLNHHHNNSNNNNNHHHVNLNRTPTVIMGEAGGVRTMLWSQPGEVIPQNVAGPGGGGHMTNGHGHPANGYQSPNQIITPSNTYNNNNISSNSNSNNNNNNGNTNSPPHHLQKGVLSMERLWASEALNLSTNPNGISTGTTNGHASNTVGNGDGLGITSLGHNIHNSNGSTNPDDEDYEQPMICMICEDRATGLHYGIITCEGCKGFFKRTVQNRRVYTCVADGTCEITKAQRNRCQYCRFKKCIEQGMVLQAVREDRMPGGRNSGAVYNLYKVPVKYRKHKKGNRVNGAGGGKAEKIQAPAQPTSHIPSIQTGKILKAALTSPNEVTHLRQPMPFETAAAMITNLVQCDNFHDIAALQNWDELLEARGDLSEKLCQMGDSIVYRLVQWTKRLPFYQEVPVDVHTRVLTHKWHELLVLTTSAWQAMHTPGPSQNMSAEEETTESLQVLQRCLQAMMGRSLTVEQLRQDVGQMVERLTHLTRAFRRLGIRIEEYVCLKVITMLQNTGTRSPEVGVIQERYIKCLRTFLEVTCPGHPNRLSDLLRTLPEIQMAATLLLESKMFYVPFLLNSALLQR